VGRPVASILGNLVFGERYAGAAAVYRIAPPPGPGLVAALADVLDGDYSLLRLARPWSLDRYAIGMEAVTDIRHTHREALGAHLDAQRERLRRHVAADTPDVFLSIRLPDAGSMDGLLEAEREAQLELSACLECERAAHRDLRWLIRRAFQRGLPQERDGPGRSRLRVRGRSLVVTSELGESHQAFLSLVLAGGRESEGDGLLAPIESVEFPVDVALCVRRRRGPDASAARLRASASVCVSATGAGELEERVEALRRRLGGERLRRSAADQLQLFLCHLPGRPSRVPAYEDSLTSRQLGALLPTRAGALGNAAGPYVGHTLGGVRRPVLFDPATLTRAGAPVTVLAGGARSGKTLLMELVMYQAFLAGHAVYDIDPKGDHALASLPQVAAHAEVLELSGEERFRGILDPLRLGPPELRERLACHFLTCLLPGPAPLAWQDAIRLAVGRAAARGEGCSGALDELRRGASGSSEPVERLARYAGRGLSVLAFGRGEPAPPFDAPRPVTTLRIPGLALPHPGAEPADVDDDQRLGLALLRLLTIHALDLATADPRRHAVLGLDEAGGLLAGEGGCALLERLVRVSGARRLSTLVATQRLGAAAGRGDLVGACFCFRADSEREAGRELRLLGMDHADADLRRRLGQLDRGRCLMRDQGGRTAAIRVDVVDPALLAALERMKDPAE
jgi:hypothetical protein